MLKIYLVILKIKNVVHFVLVKMQFNRMKKEYIDWFLQLKNIEYV